MSSRAQFNFQIFGGLVENIKEISTNFRHDDEDEQYEADDQVDPE